MRSFPTEIDDDDRETNHGTLFDDDDCSKWNNENSTSRLDEKISSYDTKATDRLRSCNESY